MDPVELSLKLMSEVNLYNQWIFKNIEPYLGKNNLEIGCGIGNISQFLVKRGSLVAIDVSPKYIEEVKEKFKDCPDFFAYQWDASSSLPDFLKEGSFDTIICLNVLEHIEDDLKALKNMNRLLKINGHLCLLVPAGRFAYGSLDKEMGHFRRYSKKGLEKKLKQAGFEVVKSFHMNVLGLIGWIFYGRVLHRKQLPSSEIHLIDRLVPVLAGLERILPPPFGLSLIVTGRKVESV